MWACTSTTLPPGSWSRTRDTGTVYIWGVGAICKGSGYKLRMAKDYYRMLLYNTGGGLRWVRGVLKVDYGAMKVEGKARLEPP